MADLFALEDLAALLQTDLDTATATVVRKIVTTAVNEASGFRLAALDESGEQFAALGSIALLAAARLFDNPTADVQETLGSWSLTHAGAGKVLTTEDREQIRGVVGAPYGGRIGTIYLKGGSIPPSGVL